MLLWFRKRELYEEYKTFACTSKSNVKVRSNADYIIVRNKI